MANGGETRFHLDNSGLKGSADVKGSIFIPSLLNLSAIMIDEKGEEGTIIDINDDEEWSKLGVTGIKEKREELETLSKVGGTNEGGIVTKFWFVAIGNNDIE